MEIYTMKNARHGEIYSVMNSTNNAFTATDKYPYKKVKPKWHMLKPKLTSEVTKHFLFALVVNTIVVE